MSNKNHVGDKQNFSVTGNEEHEEMCEDNRIVLLCHTFITFLFVLVALKVL